MVKDDMKAAGKCEGDIDKFEMQALSDQKVALGGKDTRGGRSRSTTFRISNAKTKIKDSQRSPSTPACVMEVLRSWLNASVMKTL